MFLLTLTTLSLRLVLAFAAPWLTIFYVFFEASLLPTLMLVILWGYQPERLQAGTYLILYTVGASLPLLISVLLLYFSNNHSTFLFVMWHPPSLLPNYI